MDEDMEDTYEYMFTAVEIDLDYEFDAARFFDFCTGETPPEAREAESWFDFAGSYPPSPFVAKLNPRMDLLMDNVNTSPKSKCGDDMNLAESDSDVDVYEVGPTMDTKTSYDEETDTESSINVQAVNIEQVQNQIQKISSELTFYNHMIRDNLNTKTKASIKPSYPRNSTLMKPTVSQLAKQNKPSSKFQKSFTDKNQKTSSNQGLIEVQAPKRQKLEGGQLCKVGETNQKSDLVHKEPKKEIVNDINFTQPKLRITIPQEPSLETAHRAQRIRSKTVKEGENIPSEVVPRFKARPLNRKILEAPSMVIPKRTTPQLPEFREFHLRTEERAAQHTSTIPLNNSNKLMNTSKSLDNSFSHTFKALPLNKKIFTSKGDIGVFRNTKKETTVPMEFNFQTEKRIHNPPIDLFNKLSLASDPQQNAKSQLKATLATKVLKENRQAYEIKHVTKEKPKQNQCSSEISQTRSFAIR